MSPVVRDVYAELAALPSNLVGEIVSGALYVHARPARPHGRAASELGAELIPPFRRGRGGPGGWIFLDEHELTLRRDSIPRLVLSAKSLRGSRKASSGHVRLSVAHSPEAVQSHGIIFAKQCRLGSFSAAC
jgi:hypothetical protein